MRAMTIFAAASLAVASDAAQALKPRELGPRPSWAEFRQLAEAAVRERLRDPDSAKFRWDNGYYTEFKRGIEGYTACGFVNAKNVYGGMQGYTAFVVRIDGTVLSLDIDRQPGGGLSVYCSRLFLPSIPTDEPDAVPVAASNTTAAAKVPFGLHLMSVPDGAYVSVVTPTSNAAKAGIKPGMVIERLNGQTLKGVGIEVVDGIITGSKDKLQLVMVGGQSYTLAGGAQ